MQKETVIAIGCRIALVFVLLSGIGVMAIWLNSSDLRPEQRHRELSPRFSLDGGAQNLDWASSTAAFSEIYTLPDPHLQTLKSGQEALRLASREDKLRDSYYKEFLPRADFYLVGSKAEIEALPPLTDSDRAAIEELSGELNQLQLSGEFGIVFSSGLAFRCYRLTQSEWRRDHHDDEGKRRRSIISSELRLHRVAPEDSLVDQIASALDAVLPVTR